MNKYMHTYINIKMNMHNMPTEHTCTVHNCTWTMNMFTNTYCTFVQCTYMYVK